MDIENISENEQKLLNLSDDKEFKEAVLELKSQELSKAERISKIKSILSEKGIDYTKEDAELFESIISYARDKKIKLDSKNLKNVSAGGDGISFDELPPDIQDKIMAQDKGAIKKAKIITGIVLGVSIAGVFGLGSWAGWGAHKKWGK